jgi:hypothetical protein
MEISKLGWPLARRGGKFASGAVSHLCIQGHKFGAKIRFKECSPRHSKATSGFCAFFSLVMVISACLTIPGHGSK